jgi:hypothetical protein
MTLMTSDSTLAGYWPGRWPGEDGGPRRTQAPPTGRGLAIQEGERLGVVSRMLTMSCMTVLRDEGEVYVQGNTGAGLSTDTTGWLERVHPESLETISRSPELPAGPFWPGGVAAHVNGSLYMTYGRWCHRLDPDCQPLSSRELPRDRAYNSLLILPDGHLVMKDFAGGEGRHKLPKGIRGSELCVLEPDGLEIVCVYELPEGSIARLSADVAPDGTPRVYVIGDRHAMRLNWNGASADLVLDEAWITDYIRFPGQTFGWDVVLEGGSAWFLDNGEGTNAFGPSFRGKGIAGSPLHLVRIALEGENPEPEFVDICGEPGGIIANPPAVEGKRRIAVGYDSGNGVMTAWRFGGHGEMERLWSREQNQAGHMIVFPDTGELMSYDYDEHNTEQCVILDVESGEEKARTRIGSPLQSVVFPAAGWNRDLYLTTFTTIARVFVE